MNSYARIKSRDTVTYLVPLKKEEIADFGHNCASCLDKIQVQFRRNPQERYFKASKFYHFDAKLAILSHDVYVTDYCHYMDDDNPHGSGTRVLQREDGHMPYKVLSVRNIA